MSLATRCPSCGTIFRVVQDQLRVSEGWVRCGQCQEVFHGIEALFDLDNDPAVAARRAAARTAPMPAPARVFGAPSPEPGPAPDPAPPAPDSVRPEIARVSPAPGPNRFTQPPLAARGTIAPRFAARLAEESARALGAPPPPPPPPVEPTPDLRDVAPEPLPWHAAAPEPAEDVAVAAPAAEVAPAPGLIATSPDAPVAAPAEPAEPAEPEVSAESALAAPHAEPPPAAPPLPAALPRPGSGPSTLPGRLAPEEADEASAGPPTLASMLPEHMGEWSPRARKRAPAKTFGTELALIDRSKDPRFLRDARRSARWRRPWVRASLSLALLLLLTAAVGQLAWPQRDLLAARWPATQPAWDWLCEQAGCRIGAPRAIASLTLDGSSLTRTDADHVLLFSADLHNRADHPVAVPSFDVTFMDLNGAVVARKVLTPTQLGIRQASMPAEGELHMHARLQVGSLPASGFQADLFYP